MSDLTKDYHVATEIVAEILRADSEKDRAALSIARSILDELQLRGWRSPTEIRLIEDRARAIGALEARRDS